MAEEVTSTRHPSPVASSIVITVCFAASIVTRYLVQLATAAKFGAGSLVDRYLAALAVPEVVSLVLVTAAGVTLVPILVEYSEKAEGDFWTIATGFLNLGLLLLVLLTAVGYGAGPLVIRVSVPGFTGEAFATTVRLFRILVPTAALSAIIGGLTSIYYARHSFLWPSLTPLLGSALNLAFILAFADRLGVDALAWGLLASVIFRTVALLPVLRRGTYHLGLGLGHPGLRQALALMAPLMVGSLFAYANTVFDRMVGSWLPEGSISYLGYSYRVAIIVGSTAVSGITTAILPLMSGLAAKRQGEELARVAIRTFQAGLFIVVPAFIFLGFFAPDCIGLLLERGRFDSAATAATATAFRFYLGAGLFLAPKTALDYALYALKRQTAVAMVGVGTMAVNIGLNFLLAHLLGYRGIALAHSVAIPLNALLSALLLRRALPSFVVLPSLRRFILLLGLCLGLGWLVFLGYGALGPAEGTLARAGKLTAAFLAGGVLYAFASLVLKLPEALYVGRRLGVILAGRRPAGGGRR